MQFFLKIIINFHDLFKVLIFILKSGFFYPYQEI